MPRLLGKLRSTVLTQYRALLREFRAKSSTGTKGEGGTRNDDGGEEGAEVNNLFFEWQQAKDVNMLSKRGPCMDEATRRRRAATDSDGVTSDEDSIIEAMRRCEDEAMRGHWYELYGSEEYKKISAFIRNSLRSYMSALGLEGDAASRGTTESTPDGGEVLWTWASVHNEGGRHPLHDHPDTLIAGTFYLHAPEDAGRIVFHDPRRAFAASSSGDRVEGMNIAVKPVPGMVVLFPPWVGHEVEPTSSGEERVAISFNLRGKWKYTARGSVFFGHNNINDRVSSDGLPGDAASAGSGGTPPPEPFALVMDDQQ